MMTITDMTSVADIAVAIPSSVRVFQRHGIDFCCGGKRPLGEACQDRGVAFAEIAAAIEASDEEPPGSSRDWSQEPLGSLIGHILATYHEPLRKELPRLQAMASKTAQVHATKAAYLARLEAVVVELSAGLLAHMRKEELILFPAIDAMESGTSPQSPRISAPIAMMEFEHDDAGALLAELRTLTQGYRIPEWGCATVRALYLGLSELESAMQVHVHLENNVLFPRALQLMEARVSP